MRAVFVLGAVLLAGTSSALAGPTKKPGTVVAQQKGIRYDTAPLDPALEDLKPNYLGHDCRGLAKKLVSLNPQKGEFETTAAYQSRLDGIASESVLGTVKLGDIVAFAPSNDVGSMLSEQYDADGQSLSLSDYIADGQTSVDGRLIASKKLESILKGRRSYKASNAYGKEVSVDSAVFDACALAFSNVDYMNSTSAYKLSTSFQMTPDEARAAKGHIGTLYLGKLEAPYRVKFGDYLKPTIDSPREAAWGGDALVMRLVQVWFFNKQTGKVYKKLDIP